MKLNLKYESLLKYFLFLIAFQSLAIGLFLMFFPPELMRLLGFPIIFENFFKVQGGVFHLIMVAAYVMASADPCKNSIMVVFSIITKVTSVIFLVIYFFFVSQYWIFIVALFGEIAISSMLIFLFFKFKKELKSSKVVAMHKD
ncbi:MAG: hypothetical protein JEY94_16530 [Melioribacteraceae bacterium]|nr:hypothetical protein [Melioribacteraceae bacterium]